MEKPLVIRKKQLPDNIEDLARIVIIGSSQVQAHKLSLSGLKDSPSAKQVYDQRLVEGQMFAEWILEVQAKLGEILRKTEFDQGGGDTSTGSRIVTSAKPKLKDFRITKKESHIAQSIAQNWEIATQVIEGAKEHQDLPTTNDVLREIRKQKIEKKEIKRLPVGKFNIIYADPPWEYDFSISYTRAIDAKHTKNHYPILSLEDICNIKVPAADDAVLFLWVPVPKKIEGLRVVKAWGFEYKTGMVWVKNKIGMGYYVRGQHELLFIAAKGNLPVPLPENRPSSVIDARREKHSRKPKEVYKKIEQMYPDGKYLELFATEKRPNWVSWGDQVG